MLPKKKSRRSSLFLIDPLNAALKKYVEENGLPHFRECVVCVSHVYDHELADWCLLDYDNMQQKQLLDTIALYVMEDDSGLPGIRQSRTAGNSPQMAVSSRSK